MTEVRVLKPEEHARRRLDLHLGSLRADSTKSLIVPVADGFREEGERSAPALLHAVGELLQNAFDTIVNGSGSAVTVSLTPSSVRVETNSRLPIVPCVDCPDKLVPEVVFSSMLSSESASASAWSGALLMHDE